MLYFDHGIRESRFERSSSLIRRVSGALPQGTARTHLAGLATRRAHALGAWPLIGGSVDNFEQATCCSLVSRWTVQRVRLGLRAVFWSAHLATRLRRVVLVIVLRHNRRYRLRWLSTDKIDTRGMGFALSRPRLLPLIRVAGFTAAEADGPDGCISKSLPTPGTGILKSGLEDAASVSMALCRNDSVVATWRAQISIQHCRGDATIQTTRLLHFPLTTRCAPTMQPLRPPGSRRDPAYLANLLEHQETE
ncbi:hypothetical protein E4T38_01078 [Aureobasidium subglaciale]|nr:hypothetical protein E4T38_01078 [Aureobasidium subglaciale]KAI5230743.1 hypothetical protein E4T40_01079 [Aureobasidium subglaciale]KAI5233790.1 hypothetical protein E4T41_01077 [Aureobasidium subglaciale]KAI5267219.1 hypothetical protein E4T46_01077 [Aureobasidium subglaciale]